MNRFSKALRPLKDARAIMSVDEAQNPEYNTTRSKLHAYAVLPAYAYQMWGAAPVGIGLFLKGYSYGAPFGPLAAGGLLGAAVGVQHLLLGANALEVVKRYPQTGQAIREGYPRITHAVDAFWGVNDDGSSRAIAIGNLGIQSYIYHKGFQPGVDTDDLPKETAKAGLESTFMSAKLGTLFAGISTGLQELTNHTGQNSPFNQASDFFTRNVIDQPARTGLALFATMALSSVVKLVRSHEDAPKEPTTLEP